mmetsp:Transcript_1524/g.4419  ORF Transcript_1524/g.4419 Transcript_1524/m.4419 type:complete len:260 (-) Transcript_1524:1050-1829(-)
MLGAFHAGTIARLASIFDGLADANQLTLHLGNEDRHSNIGNRPITVPTDASWSSLRLHLHFAVPIRRYSRRCRRCHGHRRRSAEKVHRRVGDGLPLLVGFGLEGPFLDRHELLDGCREILQTIGQIRWVRSRKGLGIATRKRLAAFVGVISSMIAIVLITIRRIVVDATTGTGTTAVLPPFLFIAQILIKVVVYGLILLIGGVITIVNLLFNLNRAILLFVTFLDGGVDGGFIPRAAGAELHATGQCRIHTRLLRQRRC